MPVFSYTPKQKAIMEAIRDYREAEGVSPTLEEIGKIIGGVHKVTVYQHAEALVRMGALGKVPRRYRALYIKDPDYSMGVVTPIEGWVWCDGACFHPDNDHCDGEHKPVYSRSQP